MCQQYGFPVVQYLERNGIDVPSLKQIAVGWISQRQARSSTILEDKYGVSVSHVWGMTEMTQGSAGRFTHRVERLERERNNANASRWLVVRSTEWNFLLIDSEGHEVERDGQTPGELLARAAPWVAGSYFRHDDDSHAF